MSNQQEADSKHCSVPPAGLHGGAAQCVICFKICVKTVYISPEHGLVVFATLCSVVGRRQQLGGTGYHHL